MNDDQQNDQDEITPINTDTSLQDAQASSAAADDDVDNNPSVEPHVSDELLEIKRSALQDLSPLLDSLDQEPEEKFQTTMMMIQATDNKDLIAKAYEAAKKIKEDKDRAQALLDIVNEINYFTQNKD